MYTKEDLIHDFEELIPWMEKPKKHNGQLFFKPIAVGKWTAAEIFAHIIYWDNYMMEVTIPKMTQGAEVESIGFQELNDKASVYALSGISADQLIDELILGRKELIAVLRKKTVEQFFAEYKLNGEKIDIYSGYPHTLFNYISAFVWHDHHHKQQVIDFLDKNVKQHQ
ncbi:DinB family protein [Virgibacillus siamensis]|uniref:DinB family protein n=1 Tax=Virgibacillus siamensis TaxID=480071 RepID=UPI001FEC6B79|nr:DinB family protein [Virgibacillus siamensis]